MRTHYSDGRPYHAESLVTGLESRLNVLRALAEAFLHGGSLGDRDRAIAALYVGVSAFADDFDEFKEAIEDLELNRARMDGWDKSSRHLSE